MERFVHAATARSQSTNIYTVINLWIDRVDSAKWHYRFLTLNNHSECPSICPFAHGDVSTIFGVNSPNSGPCVGFFSGTSLFQLTQHETNIDTNETGWMISEKSLRDSIHINGKSIKSPLDTYKYVLFDFWRGTWVQYDRTVLNLMMNMVCLWLFYFCFIFVSSILIIPLSKWILRVPKSTPLPSFFWRRNGNNRFSINCSKLRSDLIFRWNIERDEV